MTEPHSNKPKITQTEILKGTVTRYFLQHVSIKNIIEIDKRQYDVFKNDTMYLNIQLPWTINGPIENSTSPNGDVIYGVRHKNKTIIDWYDTKMPGLKRILNNPIEYYTGLLN